ncbi:MAG TPA: peptidase S41 [Desulfotomaculum sp.]|nr:MAG: Carboxyl-terminal protease [Desulfotomaculum sp. 46_80]HAG10494.1 peptidase S41 [Desulfotomaculum sp.]HBY04083.1 peptidase S41 [Desulfotomaculum sp.]
MLKKSVALILLIFLMFFPVLPAPAADDIEQGISTIQEIMEYIDENYITPTDINSLTQNAIEGIIDSLNDPYTEYLSPDTLEEFSSSLENQFTGIGVELEISPPYPIIKKVIEDSPAQEAGLKKDDLIITINGMDIAKQPLWDAVGKIRGPEGTFVNLGIRRSGESDFNVNIERASISGPTCDWEVLSGNTGYISVRTFSSRTAEEFNTALSQLKEKEVNGLVLDLRSNPGGYLQAAVDLADNFLPDKSLVVTTFYRDGHKDKYYTSGDNEKLDLPVVILVNEYTASASEILAGAIRDYEKASLAGVRTYGKGVIQEVIPLQNGGALKITVAEYHTPDGYSIDKKGLIPDRLVSTPELQLAAALRMLNSSGKQEVTLDLKEESMSVNKEITGVYLEPLTDGGRDYLPLRLVLEAFGYSVEYQASNESLLVKNGKNNMVLPLKNGGNTLINNVQVNLDGAILIREGRTYLNIEILKTLNIKVFKNGTEIILEED